MKKQLILMAIGAALLMVSCNGQKDNSKVSDEATKTGKKALALYIKTITATGVDEKQIKTDTITLVSSDYFEVGLHSMDNGANFLAQKDIEQPTSIDNFKAVFFYVVLEDGSEIKFKNSTEFLNFMSERGYEMVDQVKSKYHTDYTFKRRT